ncbi:MAG: glycosyltransferase family 39 protein [Planctomyces sp.]|nr:glycosyltransferase family 39 protein [Planctomyces sp.]
MLDRATPDRNTPDCAILDRDTPEQPTPCVNVDLYEHGGFLTFDDCLPTLLVLLLTVATILCRPLLPVDETRYVAVAWEMRDSGDFFVSHLNGDTYAHKPPLLFWMINAIWLCFGESEFAARSIVVPLGIISAWLTRRLASHLYSFDRVAVTSAPLIQTSCLIWLFFSPLLMFDVLLLVCTQAGMCGILQLSRGSSLRGWCFLTAGLGLGALAKGPVILVHLLPVAIFGPWWSDSIRRTPVRYFLTITLALVAGATLALAWAITSASKGGEAYAEELLWGQTAGRVVTSFAHRESWWWYLPILPLCFLPWILIWVSWSRPTSLPATLPVSVHPGRFAFCWFVGTVALLSCISGKQTHYLIPELPAFALYAAGVLSGTTVSHRHKLKWLIGSGTLFAGTLPVVVNHFPLFATSGLKDVCPTPTCLPLWVCGVGVILCRSQETRSLVATISIAAVMFVVTLNVGLSVSFWPEFDMRPLANHVQALEQNQVPVAWFGNYHGQLHFSGRLHKPIEELLTEHEATVWIDTHPTGRIIVPHQPPELQSLNLKAEFAIEVRRGLTKHTLVVLKM